MIAPDLAIVPDLAIAPDLAGEDRVASVLVVDDEDANRRILVRCLRARGYEVTAVEGGAEALAAVAAGRFDAVLLDVMMPRMSGLQVLATLRQTHSVSDLPVIMTTALARSEDVVAALRLGASDYINKPFHLEVVLAKLQTHLSLKRSKEKVQQLAEELELRNRFIRKTFGRYLSEDVVASLLTAPEGQQLGGKERLVTILMSDLRGFTSMSEGMAPPRVMQLLNNYLGKMVPIVSRHGGMINEILGDAILAVFGALGPSDDDALRAVACALEMQLAMDATNEQNEGEGLSRLEMGIALNTGDVIVGNIGSEDRAKYAVVGSHVNLTARIESFTVGGQILISDRTRSAAGPAIAIRKTTMVSAKGFKEGIVVHELSGLGAPYDLYLSEKRDGLIPLRREIAIHYSILTDTKQVEDVGRAGAIVALSSTEGEVRGGGARPASMSNLRIRVPGERADVYAKVIALAEGNEDHFRIRFTSLPVEVAALWRRGLE